MSFEAVAADAAVQLRWRTGVGAGQPRASTCTARCPRDGPWTRLTTSLIPGLGSSAIGQAYSFRDCGSRERDALLLPPRRRGRLVEGDVSRPRLRCAHGRARERSARERGSREQRQEEGRGVSVVPGLGGRGVRVHGRGLCVCGRAQLHAPRRARGGVAGCRSRDSRQTTLELRTGGFYALHETSGKVRVFVPGFDAPQDPQAPALPFRRALVDAVVGRRAELGGRTRARSGGLPWPRPRLAREGRDAGLARTGRCEPAAGRFGSPRPSTCPWISRGCCRASSRGRRRVRSSRSCRCATTRDASRSCSRSACW